MPKNLHVFIVGDIGVGKSALVDRKIKEYFSESYQATVDETTHLFKSDLGGGQYQTVYLHDFPGMTRTKVPVLIQDRNDEFPAFQNGIRPDVIIFVYDLTRLATLQGLERWEEFLQNQLSDYLKIPIILLANKTDAIQKEALGQLVNENNLIARFANPLIQVFKNTTKAATSDETNALWKTIIETAVRNRQERVSDQTNRSISWRQFFCCCAQKKKKDSKEHEYLLIESGNNSSVALK